MKERINVRQIPGDNTRRWFSSENLDLIVWYDPEGNLAGFELCYDKTRVEHSICWRPRGGFVHMAVDDGENRPGKYKASPVLVPDGHFDARRVHAAFAIECISLPQELAAYVLQALSSHPNFFDQ